MDEEKKKKKNKNKKGRQTKAAKDLSVGVGATTSLEDNHGDSSEQNKCNQVSESVKVHTPGVVESSVSLDRHHDDGVKNASLEEKIRQLQSENDFFIQREAGLEKKIINLQNEKDSWLPKQVNLEDIIKQLSDENASWILKENSMKEMLGRLNEGNIQLQAQVKELEESRAGLVQEKQHLMETISSLQLQIQHLETETSFSAFSTTEMTKLVSEHEDLNAQIEAGRELVEKLSAENAQLVEKVNELYTELDRRSTRDALSSAGFVMSGTATTAENVSESSEKRPASVERMQSFETIQMEDKSSNTNNADTGISAITIIQIEESPASYEAGESEEIVQVPLDDSEVRENKSPTILEAEEIVQVPLDDSEIQENKLPTALEAVDNVSVPLTDAPLIGAPFRLISFFAKYVSGADLVNKDTSNSSRLDDIKTEKRS